MKRKKLLVIPLIVSLGVATSEGNSRELSSIEQINPNSFKSVEIPKKEQNLVIFDTILAKKPYFKPKLAQKEPKIGVLSTINSTILSDPKNSITGKASYFCNYDTSRADFSSCHYKYPDRSGRVDLYAAACERLRNAMGKWRGKIVTVTWKGRSINVKLIDWCGSKDKTIDLYFDAFKKLTGQKPNVMGVARNVTIYWK